jgi:hypothetical protein
MSAGGSPDIVEFIGSGGAAGNRLPVETYEVVRLGGYISMGEEAANPNAWETDTDAARYKPEELENENGDKE